MAKTRSQTGNITIKKEEVEDCKSTLLLHSVNNTSSNNRITKREPPTVKNRNFPAPDIKVEQDTDTKSSLQSAPNYSELPKGKQRISQEQINQLIDAIVNDNMSVAKAARKVKMSKGSGLNYYNVYKSDPEKKIPLPRSRFTQDGGFFTQEDIGDLIRCIVDDKMSVVQASAELGICPNVGRYYYKKYLKDPDHGIPILRLYQRCTQEQKNQLISYIVNDKMTIKKASKKAKMGATAGYVYYHRYFNGRNPDLTTPSHITINKRYTQEQIKKVISYIIDDNMSVVAASRKADMRPTSARTHYRQYLKDSNIEIPVSKFRKRYTQDEINRLVGYIVDDKMNIPAASKKVNIPPWTGRKLLQRYLKEYNLEISTLRYTPDERKKFLGFIVDDKMTVKAASRKANVNYSSGKKYYQQYLKDHNLYVPNNNRITQDQIDQLIGYIVRDKMTISAASKQANMCESTGHKYYQRYLKQSKE